MKKKEKRFTAVEFPANLPQHAVAEHEVFMSFNDDLGASLFIEWWHSGGGAESFQVFLDKEKGE